MADIIKLLKDTVANQIAAGEVVQRPASVVKELLENSIDADAKDILLYVKDSGKTLIQVTDDGSGMSETDARLCFERHATSKISHAEDLFNIKTKGFRGEALASIAAVAKVELKTKNGNSELGTQVTIEGGKVTSQEVIVFNQGSSISVKNLFFNIPARRKFLKSDNVELKHIIDEFLRVAIPHHDVSFKLIHNDKTLYHIGKSKLPLRVSSLFGSKSFETFVSIEQTSPIINIKGFVKKPKFCKKSNPERYFFINNRFFRSPYFNHAINTAYTDVITPEHNPSFFIFIEIALEKIDINIHPTKTEIKFEDEKEIYAILKSSVRHAIGKFSLEPLLSFEPSPIPEVPYKQYKSQPTTPKIEVDRSFNPFKTNKPATEDINATLSLHETIVNQKPDITNPSIDIETTHITQESLIKSKDPSPLGVFQMNGKYLVTSLKSRLLILNQHRAHYRIIYEQLLNKTQSLSSQNLLFPKTIKITPDQSLFLDQGKEAFKDIGILFHSSNSKQDELILTAIPPFIKEIDAITAIENFLADSINQNNTDILDIRQSIAKKLAKSTAIKSGDNLNLEEQECLLNDFFSLENTELCPDKKPIFMEVPTNTLKNKIG